MIDYPSEPSLKNPRGLPVPPEGEAVLKTMFAGYRRLVIEKQFGPSPIYLVHPIRHHNIGELPAIVKVAPAQLIRREWALYQQCIQRRWPGQHWVSDRPLLPPGSLWGGLRYSLVGSGKFAIESLSSYARHAGLADLRYCMQESLAELMKRSGQIGHHTLTITWQAAYDRILPVNLRLSPSRSVLPHQVLTPATAPAHLLRPGQFVRLEGFALAEHQPAQQTLLLDAPPSDDHPSSLAYRVAIQPAPAELIPFKPGHLLPPLEAEVRDTRYDQLMRAGQQALGEAFDLTHSTVRPPAGKTLPNPLLHVLAILNQSRRVKMGCLHGRLGLTNILIAPATREVGLIDFAAARHDHLLHDFFHLETEAMAQFVPLALTRANLTADHICHFYEQLHASVSSKTAPTTGRQLPPALQKPFMMLQAIRRMARPHLLDQEDWTEYHTGLLIYLVGLLTAPQLDQTARQAVFWAAATTAQFISL